MVKDIKRLLKYYIILTNTKDLQNIRKTKFYIENKLKFIKILNKNQFIQVDKILEQQYNIFDSEEILPISHIFPSIYYQFVINLQSTFNSLFG